MRAWLALLGTLPLLAVGSGATASNSAPPRNGLIAVRGGEGITIVDPRTGTGTVVPKSEELSDPAWSPDGTLLAVTSWGDETDSVFRMKPDGTERTLVLRNAFSPSWAPDGKQLVVVIDNESATSLAVVNADGTGVRLLDGTADASAPKWSPDGKRIAFIDSNGRVALMTPDGNTVAMPSKIEAESVSWSPDSSKLAYDSYEGKDAAGQAVVAVLDLGSGRESILPGEQDGAESPVWSPEGDQIAFLSMSLGKSTTASCGSHMASELWIMKPDGSEAHNAAPRIFAYGAASWAPAVDAATAPTPLPPTTESRPTPKPTGATAVAARPAPASASRSTARVERRRTAANGIIAVRGKGGIYLVDPSSGKAREVPGTNELSAPSWSPDGKLLAIQKAEKGGGSSIYTIWPDGTHANMVLDNAPAPSWSDDGGLIFAVRGECAAPCDPEDDEANVLYSVRPDGSGAQRVDFEEADAYGSRDLAWPTDGSSIHFFEEESLDGPGTFDSAAATWSPDELQLAFTGALGPTEDESANSGLWVVSAEGGKPALLLSGASGRPSWSS